MPYHDGPLDTKDVPVTAVTERAAQFVALLDTFDALPTWDQLRGHYSRACHEVAWAMVEYRNQVSLVQAGDAANPGTLGSYSKEAHNQGRRVWREFQGTNTELAQVWGTHPLTEERLIAIRATFVTIVNAPV